MLKVVLAVAPGRLHALDDIIHWVELVTALTRPHSDIARIGVIEPHTLVLELSLPARFIIRVLFLSLDSGEC